MAKKLFYISLVLVSVLCLSFTRPADRYFEIARNLDIFATLFKEVNALYVDDVNPNTLVRTGIDAMLASLDPYTNYIPEDEVEDYRTMNTGQYGGIGAITREIGKRTVVTMIMEGYGAQKGGLRIGDEILKIDDVELAKLSREEASHLMKGQIGTPVSLTIKRYGESNPIKLQFKREKIKVSNVPFYGMIQDMGYVQLSDFTPDAGKEVKNAVVALKEKGARGIILDLRGNPGGLLIEAVNIANIFIPKGKLVVSTKGKIPEHNLSYETLNVPVDTEIPVTVLINRGSASASEIVAGTLQDYDRGVIVGEKSYGKGLVQVSRPLSYNSQLKVTTAKYYTPSQRCIQVLDYTHRREDGSVGSIPDSVKRAFKTLKTGRTVYDGGGIDPDVKIEQMEAYALTQVLFEKGFLFDYVTEFVHKNPTPVDPKTFALTDEQYQQFVNWMKGKNYEYTSFVEYELEQLTLDAKKEKYYEDVRKQLEDIKRHVAESKKTELTRYKDQLKMLLEEEIVSRFHLERGGVEARFKYDKEVKKAIEVMKDPQQYNKILNIG